MKALITGASGFIGGYLMEYLHEQGVEVFTLGRNAAPGAIKHYTLGPSWEREMLVTVIKDVQPDYFFHLAGSSQAINLQQALTVNTCLGADMLDAICAAGLKDKTKCLMFGSAAEYGLVEENDLPLHEQAHCKPYNYYGISKLAQTHCAKSWASTGGRALILRPFTVLGKHMPTSMAIGSFTAQIKKIAKEGGIGTLYTGNIDIFRDFVDVRDVVKISWKLINLDQVNGRIVNICSNQALSLRRMIDYMIEIAQVDVSVKTEAGRVRKVDMETHYGDNSELLQLIGSYQFISWQSSIKQMLELP